MNRNEQIIRKAHEPEEVKDINGFVALFAEDAIIWDDANLKDYWGGSRGGIVTDNANFAARLDVTSVTKCLRSTAKTSRV